MKTLIRNGTLYDGTGRPAFKADLAIEGDRIVAIGELPETPNDIVINAQDRMICPGFIDVHTHSDAYLLLEPNAPSKLYQGVTTEIVGNCGASCVPLYGDARMPSDWTIHRYPGTWRTVAEYRTLIDQVVPAPNVALLIGHNTLRAGVMGYADQPATPREIRQMILHLEQALDEGACGLSSGLVYTPGRYAEIDEIIALANATASKGGLYTSHMRSETSRVLEALDETLAVGRRTGIRIQISHLKASGRKHWHLLEKALEKIQKARDEGLDVAADRYPYTSSCTDLDIIFPGWALAGGLETVQNRLKDRSTREQIRHEIDVGRDHAYWETITIGSTAHPDNLPFQGKPLLTVAAMLGQSPAETVLHLAETDQGRTAAFFHGMSEDNMLRVLEQPWVMIGSDASLRSPSGPLSHDWPHPRAYGTFPRFLRMALDGKTVTVAEAIRKMTSLAARTYKLRDRGILKPGHAADVLVINSEKLCEKTTFAAPHALAEGIDHVFVNGTHTLSENALTGKRGGRFLPGAS